MGERKAGRSQSGSACTLPGPRSCAPAPAGVFPSQFPRFAPEFLMPRAPEPSSHAQPPARLALLGAPRGSPQRPGDPASLQEAAAGGSQQAPAAPMLPSRSSPTPWGPSIAPGSHSWGSQQATAAPMLPSRSSPTSWGPGIAPGSRSWGVPTGSGSADAAVPVRPRVLPQTPPRAGVRGTDSIPTALASSKRPGQGNGHRKQG